MTYGKKFLIHIETILLSFKLFQSDDVWYSIKSSSEVKNLEEKNLKIFQMFSFGNILSPISSSINSSSVKWILPLQSNLIRQRIDLDLDSLATFLSNLFFKWTC